MPHFLQQNEEWFVAKVSHKVEHKVLHDIMLIY